MRTTVYILFFAILILACKNEKEKGSNKEKSKSEIEHKTSLFEALVFEDKFFKENKSNIIYQNINFNNSGAFFEGDSEKPSYIEIPFTDLDLSQSFNISFSYYTVSDDGSKPQSFLAFVDKYSSPSRTIPLYMYYAGNRITGIYGDQSLWANDYNKSKGESKSYYDSYKLSTNEFYFVSINFTKKDINIYVNSELYAAYKGISPHNLKYDKIIIGAINQGTDYSTFFKGVLHGLKIYNRSLSEAEIIEVYNGQPYVETSTE